MQFLKKKEINENISFLCLKIQERTKNFGIFTWKVFFSFFFVPQINSVINLKYGENYNDFYVQFVFTKFAIIWRLILYYSYGLLLSLFDIILKLQPSCGSAEIGEFSLRFIYKEGGVILAYK